MIIMISNSFGSVTLTGQLYVVGDSSLLSSDYKSSRFAVAGSRRGLTSESIDWLKSQVNLLTPANILVSGLAIGADSIAHRQALDNDVRQIAVLPSGFDRIVPKSNIQLAHDIVDAGGCLVSLLPPDCLPYRGSFVERNKVIADLCHMLIVPQFEVKSGTRHTVNFARDLGRFIIVNGCASSGNQFIINNNSYKTIVK